MKASPFVRALESLGVMPPVRQQTTYPCCVAGGTRAACLLLWLHGVSCALCPQCNWLVELHRRPR